MFLKPEEGSWQISSSLLEGSRQIPSSYILSSIENRSGRFLVSLADGWPNKVVI